MSWTLAPAAPYTDAQEDAIAAGDWDPDRETWSEFVRRVADEDAA